MTFHDDVEYIEQMRPEMVRIAADDLQRVSRLITSGLPTIDGLRGKVDWRGDAKDLYEQRLREATDLLDELLYGYGKAGAALGEYTTAQRTAKNLVAQGVSAETRLGNLIALIVSSQSFIVQRSRPMRQWNDLQSNTGVTDWLAELGHGDEIDEIRSEADALFNEASGCYERARTTEQNARTTTVDAITTARQALPDFLADSAAARAVITGTPGLKDEIFQAAKDANARRPGDAILGLYQVEDDPTTKTFPDGGLKGLAADIFGKEPEELTASEAKILDELSLAELKKFEELRNEAFEVADQQYDSADKNDDQNDAFRHAYWNARMAQEYGDDWATRFATAHESPPGNPAAREGMDLYNNEVGRAVAAAHPGASPEETARYIREAVDSGRTLVIDVDGNLAYSDQVRPEDTGQPGNQTLPGHPQPEKTES
jgi:hypothetical protein